MTRTAGPGTEAGTRPFRLPDLGEGLVEAEVLRWLVVPGDRVDDGMPVVEVETAKAAVEIPSPWAGVVAELHADEGEAVEVGAPLLSIDVDGAPEDGPSERAEPTGADEPTEPQERRDPVLVGYGVRQRSVRRRPRRDRPARTAGGQRTAPDPSSTRPRATPPVRRFAKDSGVDLAAVRGSGPGGRVTRDDVRAAAQTGEARGVRRDDAAQGGAEPDAVRTPVTGVRAATADAMVTSAFSAPHVTEFLDVDVTATVDLRHRVDRTPEVGGHHVTVLALVARALLLAVARNPEVNASFDAAAGEVVRYRRVGLGVAVATERGLLVPVVHDAGRLSFPDLVAALADRTAVAREGRARPEDLAGGTVTLTNVGTFGVDSGTPILPPGQAAILALGAVRQRPWVVDGEVAVRAVTTLALSFDHRLVDGDLAARVLTDTAAVLTEPSLALVRC